MNKKKTFKWILSFNKDMTNVVSTAYNVEGNGAGQFTLEDCSKLNRIKASTPAPLFSKDYTVAVQQLREYEDTIKSKFYSQPN